MSFSLGTIEHKVAWVASKIVSDAKTVLGFANQLESSQPVVDLLASVVNPKAVEIERGAFSALGLVIKAVSDVEAAAAAGGLNIVMDLQTFNDFKELGKFIYAEVAKRGMIVAPESK